MTNWANFGHLTSGQFQSPNFSYDRHRPCTTGCSRKGRVWWWLVVPGFMTQGTGNAFPSDYSALPLKESKNKIIKIQKTESN